MRAERDGRTLLDCLSMEPRLAETLAERAMALTGGVGREWQYLLRARQGMDPTFDCLPPILTRLPGNMLQVDWDGPLAASSGDLPQSILRREVQKRLMQAVCASAADATFHPEHTMKVGNASVRLSDVAVTFGLSYSPTEATAVAGEAPVGENASNSHVSASRPGYHLTWVPSGPVTI